MTLEKKHAEDTCLKNHQGLIPEREGPDVSTPHDASLDEPEKAQQGTPAETRNGDAGDDGRDSDLESSPGDGDVSESFPEGGLKAWLVVLGSFCAMFSIYGLINTSAVFEAYFKANQLQQYSHSQIGWIFSLYLFLVFFVGIQVGPMFDRFGPRVLVAVGSLLIVISLMLLSLSKTYYQIILTYSVLGGLGGALLNAPAYGAIAHYFEVRRGLATGIATTAGGIGGIIFPLMLQPLLDKSGVGFAWSCRILGFMLLGLAVPANLFIKSRRSIQRRDDGKPKAASIWPDLTVFRDRCFALATLGVFFMEWGLFVPLTYIVSYATDHGTGSSDSSLLLSLLNAGSVVGRFLPGLLADKFGRFNVIIITISLCAATILGIWLPCGDSKGGLVAFCVAFGFASGSNLSLIPVCLGQFCEPQNYGRYFATATMVASFGTLSSVPIGGALLGVGNQDTGWMALILFSGASYIVALACYTSARVLTVGWMPLSKF